MRGLAKFNELETAGNVISTVQRTKEGIVYTPGTPLKYKGDCKNGVFKRGANDRSVGSELKGIVPLNFYAFEGAMYKTKDSNMKWGELIFLDSENVVCSMLIKTISLDRFVAFASDVEVYDKKSVFGNFTLNLKMVPKTSKEYGSYFYIEFEAEKADAEDVMRVRDFLQGSGAKGLFNSFTVMEFALKQNKLADYSSIDESHFTEALISMGIVKNVSKANKAK